MGTRLSHPCKTSFFYSFLLFCVPFSLSLGMSVADAFSGGYFFRKVLIFGALCRIVLLWVSADGLQLSGCERQEKGEILWIETM
jgi:hypothetical protein